MNLFTDVPGLEDELKTVGKKAREITSAAQFRQPISDILQEVFAAPGKMLRPALVLLFGRLGPEYPDCAEKLCSAGAVVELTHMASLVHDDIVDDAPFRRGRPTIQSAYGKDMAVYAGDYVLSCVLARLMTQEMLEVGRTLSRGIADMCSGELGQYAAQFDTGTDENQYFMNISGKTAALFSAACEIGAQVSGCSRDTVSAASRFGHSLGVLFQLRDDLIDCLPDSAEAGKKHGVDFMNGIYTLPVIYSLRDSAHGPKLRDLAKKSADMEPEAVFAELYGHITAAGGVEYTRWMMKQYRERALVAVAQIAASPVKAKLSCMLDALQNC